MKCTFTEREQAEMFIDWHLPDTKAWTEELNELINVKKCFYDDKEMPELLELVTYIEKELGIYNFTREEAQAFITEHLVKTDFVSIKMYNFYMSRWPDNFTKRENWELREMVLYIMHYLGIKFSSTATPSLQAASSSAEVVAN